VVLVRLFVLSLTFAFPGCSTASRLPPEPSGEPVLTTSPVSTAVNRYFHYRRLAIVARDAEILWVRYPDLRSGEDLTAGINNEGWLATRSDTARSLADIVYDLDRYERMRMRATAEDVIIVRVHGLERYIQADFSDGTAGEFILDLHLRRVLGEWTVVKTDAMTLSEYHDAMTRR